MVTDAQLATGAVTFAVIVAVSCVLLGLLLLAAYRPRSADGPAYLREVPDDLPPALVGALYRKGVVAENEIAATLLDLTARGLVEARPVRLRITGVIGGAEMTTLAFSLVDGAWERMDPLDRELFGMLSQVIGGGPVSIAALKSAARARTAAFRKGLSRWQAAIDGAAASRGLLRRSARSARWALIASAVVAPVLGALSAMVASSVEPLLITAAGAAVALGISFTLTPLTASGAQVLARYRAFERYLHDFGTLQDEPPQSVEIWSRYLAYAALFGIADRSLTALDMRLPALAGSPDLEPFRVWIASR